MPLWISFIRLSHRVFTHLEPAILSSSDAQASGQGVNAHGQRVAHDVRSTDEELSNGDKCYAS